MLHMLEKSTRKGVSEEAGLSDVFGWAVSNGGLATGDEASEPER